MKIGIVGLGKLGLPCAVAMAMKGHDVMGYDINPGLMNLQPRPYLETGEDGVSPFNPYLTRTSLRFGSLAEVAEHADLIFVAVQTPHDPRYEGTTRLPETRRDFDYRYLVDSVRNLAKVVHRDTVVVVVSTVLPGTFRKQVLPHGNPHMKFCYNPFFIAMGTTMRDFLFPEFILFGMHDERAADCAEAFYKTMTNAPFFRTTVENAELIKVSYNTYIGMKIVFANTLMEICHKTPNTNVDEISRCLGMATRRLISPAYMSGGMGDGGGCHPRDNIAMSWLAQELGLSSNLFEHLMSAREKQTEWLADLMCEHHLPKAIFGYSFKPGTNITTGSPALLLRRILEERGHQVLMHDPHVDATPLAVENLEPMVILIGSKHPAFSEYRFAPGTIVLDPWRYLPKNQKGVRVIPLGCGPTPCDAAAFLSMPNISCAA